MRPTTTGSTGPPRLLSQVIRACRQRLRRPKVVDSTGAELSGGELLARALILRRLLRRHVLRPEEARVGILLPPTAAAVVANLALALDRRTLVNLNYTLSGELIDRVVAQAGLRHVVTSRRFLERLPFAPAAELVILEELAPKVTGRDKAIGALLAFATPAPLLARLLGLDRLRDDDLLTIIFTSGTTGDPKGVMLTYANVASNVDAVDEVIRLRPTDVLIGVLPFFHAFGFTVTLWTALEKNIEAAYHTNPLEGRAVGRLCRERHGTILLATPTFLRSYLHRTPPADFASLEVVVTGGEPLPADLADAFEARFGIRPVEGYGATETSPLISSNIPPNRALGDPARDERSGTVGRPAPGVRVRVTDLETGEPLGPGERGLLWVSGPNVMRGYLDRPEATAEVIQDGWYRTGDVATVDADGFVRIVGRLSRFAKIGGEMIPFAPIEEALAAIVGAEEDGMPRAAVAAVPDPVTGERLVVVHAPIDRAPIEVTRLLAERGLPTISIPSPRDFVEIEQLPRVGIGKVDLKRIEEIARTRAPARAG